MAVFNDCFFSLVKNQTEISSRTHRECGRQGREIWGISASHAGCLVLLLNVGYVTLWPSFHQPWSALLTRRVLHVSSRTGTHAKTCARTQTFVLPLKPTVALVGHASGRLGYDWPRFRYRTIQYHVCRRSAQSHSEGQYRMFMYSCLRLRQHKKPHHLSLLH